MDATTLLNTIDQSTARAFVSAARHVIDAMLIEAERVQETQTPPVRQYGEATLSREAPAGGWISHEELRSAARKLAEAIAAERWTDGALAAIRLFGMFS